MGLEIYLIAKISNNCASGVQINVPSWLAAYSDNSIKFSIENNI